MKAYRFVKALRATQCVEWEMEKDQGAYWENQKLFARGGIQRMLASLKIVKQLIEAYLLASVKHDQFTFTISL